MVQFKNMMIAIIFLTSTSVAYSQVIMKPYDTPPEPVGGYTSIQREVNYPDEAKELKVEGTVIVTCLILPSGEVDSLVAVAGDSLLHKAAMEAIGQISWKPGRVGDMPVTTKISVPVVFKLKGGSRDRSLSRTPKTRAEGDAVFGLSEKQKLAGTILILGILYFVLK